MHKQRIAWMDLVRGLAIILVIANHALHSDQQSIGHAPDWLVDANDVLSPLRMPVVVFMSGLLVSGSLTKTTRVYMEGKLRNIAWPFVVWTVVGYCWVALVLHLRGDPPDVIGPFTLLATPYDHLWFLEHIFAFYLIALLTRRINPLWISGIAFAAGFLVDDKVLRFVMLLAFFMAGAWFARHHGLFERVARRREVAVAAVVLLIVLVMVGFSDVDVRSALRYQPHSVPFVAAALVLVGRAAMAIADRRWTRPIRNVGELSLVYYVTHGYPVALGAWVAIQVFGVGVAPIAVGFVVGLLASALMAWAYPRVRAVHALYSFPRPRRRAFVTAA